VVNSSSWIFGEVKRTIQKYMKEVRPTGLQPLVPLLLPDLAIALMGIFILVTQA
jgi:hypothetical protein